MYSQTSTTSSSRGGDLYADLREDLGGGSSSSSSSVKLSEELLQALGLGMDEDDLMNPSGPDSPEAGARLVGRLDSTKFAAQALQHI